MMSNTTRASSQELLTMLWNLIPQTAVSQTTLEAFQKLLDAHSFWMPCLVFAFYHFICTNHIDNMDWGQHVSEISSKATKTLGFLRRNLAFAPRSTKEAAYKTLVRPKLEYAAPIWSPHSKLQINQIEKVQRTAARWTCRRWRNTSSVSEMLDELEWPSLEARRDQSSLLLFHKIHCGAVSIEKDKYMTPAHSLKITRSSHSAQYCRHQTYSDALKNSFFPWTIPHWNSLPPSVANTQSTEEFRALLI